MAHPSRERVERAPVDDLLDRLQAPDHTRGNASSAASPGGQVLDARHALPPHATVRAGEQLPGRRRGDREEAFGTVQLPAGRRRADRAELLPGPSRAEVEYVAAHGPEPLVLLGEPDHVEFPWVEVEREHRRIGQQQIAPGAGGSLHAAPLQQSMGEDHVATCQLRATGDPLSENVAHVADELQVEGGNAPTRVARAGRGLGNALQPPLEGEIRGIDGVEQHAARHEAGIGPEERRVTLEFLQTKRAAKPSDDGLDEVARDERPMLGVALGEVRRVPGQIGKEKVATLQPALAGAHVPPPRVAASSATAPRAPTGAVRASRIAFSRWSSATSPRRISPPTRGSSRRRQPRSRKLPVVDSRAPRSSRSTAISASHSKADASCGTRPAGPARQSLPRI